MSECLQPVQSLYVQTTKPAWCCKTWSIQENLELSTARNWEGGNFDLNLLVSPFSSFQKEVVLHLSGRRAGGILNAGKLLS